MLRHDISRRFIIIIISVNSFHINNAGKGHSVVNKEKQGNQQISATVTSDKLTDNTHTHTHTHTDPFIGPLSGITQVSRYQKGTANLDFTEARDSEWQWHQLGHMQVCSLL